MARRVLCQTITSVIDVWKKKLQSLPISFATICFLFFIQYIPLTIFGRKHFHLLFSSLFSKSSLLFVKRKNPLMEFKWREKFARPLRLAPLNHSRRLDSSFRRYDFKARFFVRLFKIAGIPRINFEADEILFIL